MRQTIHAEMGLAMTMRDNNTLLMIEEVQAKEMGNDQIRQHFMIWSVRASQAYGHWTAGMLAIYTAEYIARGLNK